MPVHTQGTGSSPDGDGPPLAHKTHPDLGQCDPVLHSEGAKHQQLWTVIEEAHNQDSVERDVDSYDGRHNDAKWMSDTMPVFDTK